MTRSTPRPFEQGSDSPRPVRTEAEYQQALAAVERLFEAQPGTPDGDRLDLLVLLVEDYERRQFPILPPDPIEALLYLMERRGLREADLEPYLGGRGMVADILNRQRALTLEMIRRLHDGLDLPADLLIRPYRLQGRSVGEEQAV